MIRNTMNIPQRTLVRDWDVIFIYGDNSLISESKHQLKHVNINNLSSSNVDWYYAKKDYNHADNLQISKNSTFKY